MSRPRTAGGSRGLRVLVIEDEHGVADFVRSALDDDRTAEIKTVSTVPVALESIRAAAPDLVVVGIAPPSQPDACRLLRKSRECSSLPIMVMWGRISEQDRIRALDAGADDCLDGTHGSREFAARVRALVRRRGRVT